MGSGAAISPPPPLAGLAGAVVTPLLLTSPEYCAQYISDVHPSEPVIRTATAKIFDKSNFLPPKNSLLSIKSEKDIQNLNVKELKVCATM